METYVLFTFVVLVWQWNSCFGQFLFNPSFQMQNPSADFRQLRPFSGSQQFRSPNRNLIGASQSPLLHTTPGEPKLAPPNSETKQNGETAISEIMRAFSDISEKKDEVSEERSSRDYGYPAYGPPQQYGYAQRPSYGPPPSYVPPPPSYQHGSYAPPPSYHHESYAPPPSYHHESYAPQTPAHHHSASKISLLKPALDLVKPVTTKVASKVSGLIGLVLALLTGSSADDLELKGFKDIVINGIVRPLMLAKGGLKSLISKLAIPTISLLLINLEVLITIWWLWEDCPEPVQAPAYQKPTYNYNSNY